MSAERLTEIADRLVTSDPGTKGRGYYEIYDRYFHELARPDATMLELGVYQGQSTKVFASYFGDGKIIAVDNLDRGLDFSAFPNVFFERADQRSGAQLAAIQKKHAPAGFDIIIDDAAHIGAWSRASYEALFPLLKPSGLYIVEDWGTGYWNDWPDGRMRRPAGASVLGWLRRKRIPSHDYGMVGFLKGLIDDLSDGRARSDGAASAPALAFVHVYGGLAVLKKS
jgi:SAM-dependent methyltransferase